MMIGLGTGSAIFAVIDTSVKQSNAIAGRVNATQRGRLVMDTITRQLRSQVCFSPVVPALIDASDDKVTFYADLSDGTRTAREARARLQPATKRHHRAHLGRHPGDPDHVPDDDDEPADHAPRVVERVRPRTPPDLPLLRLQHPGRRRVRRPAAHAAESPPTWRAWRRSTSASSPFRPAAKPLPGRVGDARERDLRPRRRPQRPSTHTHMRLIPRLRTRFLAVRARLLDDHRHGRHGGEHACSSPRRSRPPTATCR